MKTLFVSLILALGIASAEAQENFNIPTDNGEIIISTERERDFAYGEWHYSPAYRAGNFVFFSGVVAGPKEGEAYTPEAYKEQLRRVFSRIEVTLQNAGTSFDNVVKLRTFHVFDSPYFEGDKSDHFKAFREVKDEFITAQYPAWTAIGIVELLPEKGLVEIELIAVVPGEDG